MEPLETLMVGEDIVINREPYWVDIIHSDGSALGGLKYDEAYQLGLALVSILKPFMDERKRQIEEEIDDEKSEKEKQARRTEE